MVNKSIIALLLCMLSISGMAQTPGFETEDYQKALWMTTRFYGAQRMGKNCNNWVLWDYKGNNLPKDYLHGDSYIKDADGNYDLTGGWFDCGDYVLFGQTFYYSVYTLLLGYSEFTEGYGDYYSQDYKEYTSKGKYTFETSKSGNSIPDILDECKWATDFCLKAYNKEKNVFYYQKGDGAADHKSWTTSPTKSTKSKSEGGESDGSREILSASGNVTDMAALAGASLAVMSRVYKSYDATYAAKCLAKAKEIYDFVKKSSKGNTASPTDNATGQPFYSGKGSYIQDETILYAELYRATNDAKYKTDMENAASEWIEYSWDHGWVYCYTKTHDAAAYLLGSIANKYQNAGKNALKNLVTKYKGDAKDNRFDRGDYGWGYLRYIADQAFVAGLDAKLNETSGNDDYVYTTIDYIMGKNSGNFSYIVGFGSKFPNKPHHRNIYRNDDNNMYGVPAINASYPYHQFGFLVGGANNGTYSDNIDNYVQAEGGIDYNAGLVGALGYINSKLAPVEIPEDPENPEEPETPEDPQDPEKPTASEITIKTTPKTSYYVGEKFDVKGGVIVVTYSDKTKEEVKMTADMISGFSSKIAGTVNVTVTYLDLTTKLEVTVAKPSVTAIYMEAMPKKTKYEVGEALQIGGGSIKVEYKDGSSEVVKITDAMVSGYNPKKIGDQNVNVKYGNISTSYKVTVENREKSIKVTTNPKQEYIYGEFLDLTEGVISVYMSDGTSKKINMNADMVKGYDPIKIGIQQLTVTYNSLETVLNVRVLAEGEQPGEPIPDPDGNDGNGDGDDNGDEGGDGDLPTPVEIIPAQQIAIYSYGHTIYIKDYSGLVEIYTTGGTKVYSGTCNGEIMMQKAGVYIVKAGQSTKKIAIR